MKIWYPLFGFPGDCLVCKKWLIKADTQDEALIHANHFWDSLSPVEYMYYYPALDWRGPLFGVVEATFSIGNIHIL